MIVEIGQPAHIANLSVIEARMSAALQSAGFDENIEIEADVLDAYLRTARRGSKPNSLGKDDRGKSKDTHLLAFRFFSQKIAYAGLRKSVGNLQQAKKS